MKEIKMNLGKVALVSNKDFKWLNQWKWFAAKGGNVFYATRNVEKDGITKTIKMHREILGLVDPKIFTDHKDGNGLNNQRSNLRIATRSQNKCNAGSHKNSSSKFVGVSWHPGAKSWCANISKDGHTFYLGYFKDEQAAAMAYNKVAKKIHGKFARLNKI